MDEVRDLVTGKVSFYLNRKRKTGADALKGKAGCLGPGREINLISGTFTLTAL